MIDQEIYLGKYKMWFNKKYKFFILSLMAIILLGSCDGHKIIKLNNRGIIPSQAIQGGIPYPDKANPPRWIGALYNERYSSEEREPACTVEFISKLYVLTSLHCVNEYQSHLHDLKIQYRGLKNESAIYAKISVESFIVYKSNYDITLLKLEKIYPGPVEMVPLYHEYSFNKYDSIVNNKINIKHLGYGDLRANPTVDNLKSILMQTTGKVSATYNSMVLATTTMGALLPGDSGGPVLFTDLPTDKLIGVYMLGLDTLGTLVDSILIIKDILKWIATTTGVPIFNNIIENQYILVSKDNTITVSGWGNMPINAQIVVYNSNNNYTEIVASCHDFKIIDNQWQCNIQFESNYDYSKNENYKASIISDNKEMDYVYFKLAISAQNIKILHPVKHKDRSNVWFTYHTPVGESYLITGTATPDTYLTYDLVDIATDQSNKSPCANLQAIESVPNSGVWQCRIMVNTSESKVYDFILGLDTSRDPLPDNRKRPLEPNVDSVQYKVEPLKEKLSLKITYPLENNVVLYPYQIIADVINSDTPIVLKTTINSGIYYDSIELNKIDENKYRSDLLYADEVGKFNLKASLYIDEDENPIVTESVNYVVKDYFVKFTSPQRKAILTEGEELYPRGTATDITDITDASSVPSLIVEVTIFKNGDNIRHDICKAYINRGVWTCDKNKNVDISDLPAGKYTIEAYLLNDDTDKEYTSSTVPITIVKKVNLDAPSSSSKHSF